MAGATITVEYSFHTGKVPRFQIRLTTFFLCDLPSKKEKKEKERNSSFPITWKHPNSHKYLSLYVCRSRGVARTKRHKANGNVIFLAGNRAHRLISRETTRLRRHAAELIALLQGCLRLVDVYINSRDRGSCRCKRERFDGVVPAGEESGTLTCTHAQATNTDPIRAR